MIDPCPSRDDIQPHIVENGRCVLCLKSVISESFPPKGSGKCVVCGEWTTVGHWGYVNEWTEGRMEGNTYIPGHQISRKTFDCGCSH